MKDIYEKPWKVGENDPQNYYHTIEIPGAGTRYGLWDLRPGIEAYLGGENYMGRRVLEIGTANGFVCFELERRGAEVIAFDLAEGYSYDLIPAKAVDREVAVRFHAQGLKKIKNAFWRAHQLFGSRARVVYGHANHIPQEIGPVDYVFLGNVLQHLENPLGAITSATGLARRIVVTETNWISQMTFNKEPLLYFLPALKEDDDPLSWCFSWWQVTPALLEKWLKILGFRVLRLEDHEQYLRKADISVPHFTLIAEKI